MRMVKAASFLLLSLIISACSTVKEPGSIKTVILYPPYDYRLVSCAPEPQAGEVRTQEEFGIWTEEVRQAGEDCRQKLYGLRSYLESWELDVEMKDIWWEEGGRSDM